MAKKKTENTKKNTNREVIDLKEFLLLDAKKQDKKIKDTLEKMYEGEVEVTKKHIEKVLNICFDTKDDEIYLPESLKVEKTGSKLWFYFAKRNSLGLIILFLLAFLFMGGFATYTGVQYLSKIQLNIDLDGDGIPDLNIDLDDDGICDINCDTDKDGKPDVNIDYQSNRKPIFNVLLDDGTLFNPTNQDIDGDGVCDINCDTDGDGWPDLNIDYDGDGVVDFDRDIDGDGIPDLDLDLDGDGVCDLNCDDDKDDICDRNCTAIVIDGDEGETGQSGDGGGTSQSGDSGLDFDSASLVVVFESQNNVLAENVYPDDQTGQGVNTTIPDLVFTVENTTNNTLYYNLSWVVSENTFESSNFWFRVVSDNNGYNIGWTTAPTTSGILGSNIEIAPNTTQTYRISFTLHGTGEEQNYDQGKVFNAQIAIDLAD